MCVVAVFIYIRKETVLMPIWGLKNWKVNLST